MNRQSIILIVLLGAVFVPQVASANAGTPLMWAGMLHLALGNALIGIFEGMLIAKCFKLPYRDCVPWMIGANYLSAWAGMFGLDWLASKLDWNLYNGWSLFWVFVAIAFLCTALLEWPLVALCFWKADRWIARSVKATLLAQSASYLLLFGWYWVAGVQTLYTQMNIVSPSELRLPSNLKLFYISSKGQVCEGTEVVSEVTSNDPRERLVFAANPDQANSWTLKLLLSAKVVKQVSGSVSSDEAGRDTWMNFGKALRLDTSRSNKWEFYSGFWAASGLRGTNKETGETLRFGWEMPFGNWIVRNVIQLPDERAIFQLGYDQICLLDPDTRRVALLVRGRGPAVLLE